MIPPSPSPFFLAFFSHGKEEHVDRSGAPSGNDLLAVSGLMVLLFRVQAALRFKPKAVQSAIVTLRTSWKSSVVNSALPVAAWAKLYALGLLNACAHWRQLTRSGDALTRCMDGMQPSDGAKLAKAVRKTSAPGASPKARGLKRHISMDSMPSLPSMPSSPCTMPTDGDDDGSLCSESEWLA